nr:hypothetical protein [Candidatus Woesebacteria bacterium]
MIDCSGYSQTHGKVIMISESNYSAYSAKKHELSEAQAELGDIQVERYCGELHVSFGLVGEKHKADIRRTLEYKQRDPEQYGIQREFTDSCLIHTRQKLQELKSTAPQLASGLQTYLLCLQEWAAGAEISMEEAWYLQNESFGCQTVLVQGNDDKVFLAHTEEWSVDKEEKEALHIQAEWSEFVDSDQPNAISRQAFTGYPFALPGSSFWIANGVVGAVDSLELRSDPDKLAGIPAGVTAWLCWYWAGQVDAEVIIKAMGYHAGGYALNQLVNTKDGPRGRVIEFAGDMVVTKWLEPEALTHLIHTNLVEDRELAQQWGAEVSRADKAYYRQLERTHKLIRRKWQERFRGGKQAPVFSLESLEKELALVPLVERSGWPSIDQRTNTARPKGTVTTIAQPFTNSTFVVSLDS